MHWQIHDTIHALPDGLWEQMVARGKCTTSARFLSALEKTHADQTHLYFVAYQPGKAGRGATEERVVGCAMLVVMRHDLCLEMQAFARRLVGLVRRVWPTFLTLRLAMTGTLETYGNHYWFDPERLTLEEFVDSLLQQFRAYRRHFRVLVVRDFIMPEKRSQDAWHFEQARAVFALHGFPAGDALPVASIDISGFATPEAYLASLKSRDRYTIRKAIKKGGQSSLASGFEPVSEDLLDECYPLYLAVNQRATELVTAPLPRCFFTHVQADFGTTARMYTARDAAGALVGFGLILETQESMEVFAVGLDYDKLGSVFSMYNLLWECIAEAIRNRRARVDLGVTNTFIKTRFGAEVAPMKVLYRASNPLLRRLLRSAFSLRA